MWMVLTLFLECEFTWKGWKEVSMSVIGRNSALFDLDYVKTRLFFYQTFSAALERKLTKLNWVQNVAITSY